MWDPGCGIPDVGSRILDTGSSPAQAVRDARPGSSSAGSTAAASRAAATAKAVRKPAGSVPAVLRTTEHRAVPTEAPSCELMPRKVLAAAMRSLGRERLAVVIVGIR